MSVFVMKLIAVVSMFIDHLTYVAKLSGSLPYGTLYYAGRAIGRPAFVIYCFLLVNGYDKTQDRKKYLSRLILFSLVSQLPFTLAFTPENYLNQGGMPFHFDALTVLPLLLPLSAYYLFVCERRAELSLLWLALLFTLAGTKLRLGGLMLFDTDMNVFCTLAVAMAMMMFFDWLSSEGRSWGKGLFLAAALGAELFFLQQNADYGLAGVGLILGLYFSRRKKLVQLTVAALWCVLEYNFYAPYVIGALAALLPIALYSGKLGRKLRTAFYVFYPAHLTLLGAVFILLRKTM